jgi:hypothetical protein
MGCIVLLSIRLSFRQKDTAATESNSDRLTADALEREVRSGLPLGSPLPEVRAFLAKRKIEFSYEASSKSMYAVVRKLKGSTTLVTKSLQLQFHFDDVLHLKSIDTKVLYTGP